MAAEWIQVALRGWAFNRCAGGEFLENLSFAAEDGFRLEAATKPGQATLIWFVDEELAAHSAAADPYKEFAAAVERALLKAAAWIGQRRQGAFDGCRSVGIIADVFIGSWINQDQFDLDLPAPFLLACGQAGLSISIVTND
jgi:hypothetical protein